MQNIEAETEAPDLRYDRICRTPSSEAYLVSDDEGLLGRVDLHFGSSIVHGVLILEREMSEAETENLVATIDEDLVWTADQPREDFAVTVYRGSEITMLADDDRDDESEESEVDD